MAAEPVQSAEAKSSRPKAVIMRLPSAAGRVLAVLFVTLGLSACGESGQSKADRLEVAMRDAAMSVPGVESASIHINVNTSGNFITAKVVGTGTHEAALIETYETALPAMLKETRELKSGTFSCSIFSPDNTVSIGAGALGYPGGSSLQEFQEFFVD